jgi:lantibiotic transport system permease protein
MEEKDFLKKMESLKKPDANTDASQKQIKLAVLNAKRSATWGTWFLVIPLLFFACVVIKYFLHWNWGIAGNFLDWMAAIDQSTAFPIVTIMLFIILPATGAVINLLAVMHFVFDRVTRELIVTIKLRWVNIILAIISIGILAMVLLYSITENAAERAIHRIEKAEKQMSDE